MADTSKSSEMETNADEVDKNVSSGSKESEGENVDAIKRFIQDQEKEIQEQKIVEEETKEEISVTTKEESKSDLLQESLAVAASVISETMDKIISETETESDSPKELKDDVKQSLNTGDKAGGSISLSVGSQVEAKDYSSAWYDAQIIEVDYDEMEVLVHYENDLKKHDEWISVSSPRLRPAGTSEKLAKSEETLKTVETVKPETVRQTDTHLKEKRKEEDFKQEPKEEKSRITFAVGERCLARWRDGRRFVATISKDLGKDNYEIIFDDGSLWTCAITRLHKLKPGSVNDPLTVDTSSKSPSTSTLSPQCSPGPGPGPGPGLGLPFHTHLFDPTRDYLSSKSERREMKRKLNIKEIFNIGQKKQKKDKTPSTPKQVERKPRVFKKRSLKLEVEVPKCEVKLEIPDAVASIIGTVSDVNVKDEPMEVDAPEVSEEISKTAKEVISDAEIQKEVDVEKKDSEENIDDKELITKEVTDQANEEIDEVKQAIDEKLELDTVLKEEVKLEKFDKEDDQKHEEVIDRIKEVINKLEDGLYNSDKEKVNSPKPEIKIELKREEFEPVEIKSEVLEKKKVKIKRSKKLRLLQEKKVKKQVEKVKCELEEMKKQFEEMRQQMLLNAQELAKPVPRVIPESFLLPGEWCCKWVNGQPVGTVSEMEGEVKYDANNKPALPRRSVQVEDKRLPPGWTKHMVRRSQGHSAGKWDIVLINPENRRFHTRNEMRLYIDSHPDQSIREYENGLMDFGAHLKLARRMGWYTENEEGPPNPDHVLVGSISSTSPLVKRKKLNVNKEADPNTPTIVKRKKLRVNREGIPKRKRLTIKLKLPKSSRVPVSGERNAQGHRRSDIASDQFPPQSDMPPLEDGFVFVGSLKVQVIDTLLRCPAEGCFKNFRNNTLLKMHIKHYHRELRKLMGTTPKVADLAYARTMPIESEIKKEPELKGIKVKLPRLPKRVEEPRPDNTKQEIFIDTVSDHIDDGLPNQDSPKLRHALINKPVKRPRVLLPVRRTEPEPPEIKDDDSDETTSVGNEDEPLLEALDFETAISTHTVTKPLVEKSKKKDKHKFAAILKRPISEEDDWYDSHSDVETRSSFPRSMSPDLKIDVKTQPMSSESNEDRKDPSMYMYTENGERIKIVHMKREEIINCHCGFREEDGLMVQCELCLCWQHALCHNIQKESEVPEKYTCSICLNPRRGRRSQRFLHDQDRMYEGLLPGAKPCESLRRSHELSGNLLRIDDALHALRVKCHVATKKDHPKLYLWAKDWEHAEINYTQEKLNSDYSDLNIMINTMDKENLPVKAEDIRDMQLDMRTPSSDDHESDRYIQRDGQIGSQSLLSGLLSSPGGGSLDLAYTTELERLAKSVQAEQESPRVRAPQPEAAIENSACRARLLRHVQRCHALLDARLDSIHAQVAELESQDPSFEDDETADYFPRTKQTIQMLLRDLETMEELGVIT